MEKQTKRLTKRAENKSKQLKVVEAMSTLPRKKVGSLNKVSASESISKRSNPPSKYDTGRYTYDD